MEKLFSDVVWRCPLKEPKSSKALATLPALLIEHKSQKPRYPYVQLADYRQQIHHVDLKNGQFQTLFELGEGFLATEAGRNFMRAMLVYYAKSADLSGENLKIQIETKLSGNMKAVGKSTYDQLIEEGIMIGEARGKAEGKAETSEAVAEALILEFPGLSDEKVAALSKSTPEMVALIRARLILEGKLTPSE